MHSLTVYLHDYFYVERGIGLLLREVGHYACTEYATRCGIKRVYVHIVYFEQYDLRISRTTELACKFYTNKSLAGKAIRTTHYNTAKMFRHKKLKTSDTVLKLL